MKQRTNYNTLAVLFDMSGFDFGCLRGRGIFLRLSCRPDISCVNPNTIWWLTRPWFCVKRYASSPVAQSVEQVAVNHLVRGSSPRWGAIKNRELADSVSSLFVCGVVDGVIKSPVTPPKRQKSRPKQERAFVPSIIT